MNIFKARVYDEHPVTESKLFIKMVEMSIQTENNNISKDISIQTEIIEKNKNNKDLIDIKNEIHNLNIKLEEQYNMLYYGMNGTFVLILTFLIFK